MNECQILFPNDMAGNGRDGQLLADWFLLLGAPLFVMVLLVKQSQLHRSHWPRLRHAKQSLVRVCWCYRRLFSSLAACYFLLVLKVDIGHHPVGPLHHLAVAHTGGGEGRVDAGGAGALVAVRHET